MTAVTGQRPRVFVAAPSFLDEEALRCLRGVADVVVGEAATLEAALANYDALIIGVRHHLGEEQHHAATRTRVLCTLSSGTEHIAPCFFEDSRIAVLRTTHSPARAVAEHALSLALSLSRQLPRMSTAGRAGQDRSELGTLGSLIGCNLGVLGAGATAKAFVELTAAFGAKVRCFTRHPDKHPELKARGIEFASLPEVMRASDVLSIHLPLTHVTRGLVGKAALSLLPHGALVVNTARSAVMDCQAAFDSVQAGRLGGVAIDDFISALPCAVPDHPGILVTPHVATRTAQCMVAMQREAARLVADALTA